MGMLIAGNWVVWGLTECGHSGLGVLDTKYQVVLIAKYLYKVLRRRLDKWDRDLIR
jgi:hypothetical protein